MSKFGMIKGLISVSFLVLGLFVLEKSEHTETRNSATVTVTVELTPKLSARSAGMYGRGRAAQSQPAATESRQKVAIWITGENMSATSPDEMTVLNQVDLQFLPQIIMVSLGEEVRILNSDPVYHNVFSLSRTKRFDVGRRPKGDHLDVLFDREGIVDVFCDIHSNMHAVIIVMPAQTHTWTTITSGDQFQVNLPDGNYTLHIYASGYDKTEREFSVENAQNKNLGTIRLDS